MPNEKRLTDEELTTVAGLVDVLCEKAPDNTPLAGIGYLMRMMAAEIRAHRATAERYEAFASMVGAARETGLAMRHEFWPDISVATSDEAHRAAQLTDDVALDELQFEPWPPGPSRGGQHVTRMSTGVVAYHVRTGTGAICNSERSMQANRERAVAMLHAMHAAQLTDEEIEALRDLRASVSANWMNEDNAAALAALDKLLGGAG